MSAPCPADNPELEQILSMLTRLDRRRGVNIRYKISTVRSNSVVRLEPGREYLIWGKLPKSAAVMTAFTSCRSTPRGIIVVMVAPLRQVGWLP